jgi:hypothetical protein
LLDESDEEYPGSNILPADTASNEYFALEPSTEKEATLIPVDDHALLITQPLDRGVTW